MVTNLIALQDSAGASGAMNLIMIVALIVIFWLFMIRPQQKRQKEIRKFREGISKGDRVITAGGIYGKVVNIKDNIVSLQIGSGVIIEVDKGSVYPSAQDVAQDPNKEAK